MVLQHLFGLVVGKFHQIMHLLVDQLGGSLAVGLLEGLLVLVSTVVIADVAQLSFNP